MLAAYVTVDMSSDHATTTSLNYATQLFVSSQASCPSKNH